MPKNWFEISVKKIDDVKNREKNSECLGNAKIRNNKKLKEKKFRDPKKSSSV